MHTSVLLHEAIEYLNIKADGIYIDGTFGFGGHSKLILQHLNDSGKLVAFDKDIDACNHAKNIISDTRFSIIHDSFTALKAYLLTNYQSKIITDHNDDKERQDKLHLEQLTSQENMLVDGILLDLGVSSLQLDSEVRGFSFKYDAPLDMRMNVTNSITCSAWLATVSEHELANVLWLYGEERFAKKIAKAIIDYRIHKAITTTGALVDIIVNAIPYKEPHKHPATRSFQALRIKINHELDDLEQILNDLPELLKVGGCCVIISFHSLEDRLVKNKFRVMTANQQLTNNLPKWALIMSNQDEQDGLTSSKQYTVINKIKPQQNEIRSNKRARSAILRVLQRTR